MNEFPGVFAADMPQGGGGVAVCLANSDNPAVRAYDLHDVVLLKIAFYGSDAHRKQGSRL